MHANNKRFFLIKVNSNIIKIKYNDVTKRER